jgi:hypothetical protein
VSFLNASGLPIASCKDIAVLNLIPENGRGFRVYTGAPTIEGIKPELYQYIDFGVDNLTSIVNIATAYPFTPPNSIPVQSSQTASNAALLAVWNRLSTTVFKACCATEVTVTGDGVLFFDTYADLPVTGLPDILYVVQDGSGQFIWNTTTLSYDPVFYNHPTLPTFAYSNFT